MPVLLDRRSFLTAAASTSLTLPSTAFATAVPSSECAHGIADTLTLEQTLLNGNVAPKCLTAAGWEADKLFNQAAATMVWSGRARGAGPAEFEDADLAEAIDARMDGMVRTLWAAALEVDTLDTDGITELDPQAIYDYLYFNVVPGPGSASSGLRNLPAAHLLEFRDGRSEVRSYWRPV